MPKHKESQEKSWYAVHTYAGYEDAVARYLKQRVESLDMHDKIFNIVVPKEKKIKIKGGRRYSTEEKVYPGYVLVEMILNDDSWYVVRNTPRVTGFIGADSTTPTPLSEEEVSEIMKRTGAEEPKYKIDLRVGDVVKITDGPFKDFDGKVSELEEETAKVKVLVSIFGRETPVELDFLQVKKI
jgi:transcriptional antiterminator NusG